MIADGDKSYTFDCLTPDADIYGYTGNCQIGDTTTTNRPCVCTLEYDPWCCDGEEFGNKCKAGCSGWDALNDDRCDNNVCPDTTSTDTPCVCTKEYDPYCCNGEEFGNKCLAECGGWDYANDCENNVCPDTTSTSSGSTSTTDDVSDPSGAYRYGIFIGFGFIA